TLKQFVEDATAPDPLTVVISWKGPYPGAGESDWQLLPNHLFGGSLAQMDTPDAFAGLRYWTTEFVGLGPYRLDRWEPGAFIEGSAFAGYVHGKPRIERLQMVWVPDPNAAVANLLADSVHLATD